MTANAEAVVAELRSLAPRRGDARRVARHLGVSPSIVCRVLKGKLPPSDKVAEGLGFKRVSYWEKVFREEELALADRIEAELNSPPLLKEGEPTPRAWCAQCEAMVHPAAAVMCRSQWCKLK